MVSLLSEHRYYMLIPVIKIPLPADGVKGCMKEMYHSLGSLSWQITSSSLDHF